MVGAVIDNSANANLNNLTTQAGAGLNSVSVRTVVETYTNGTNWYRIWSDGFCEQGGRKNHTSSDTTQTVNLLKAYKNTNYTVVRNTKFNGTYDCYPVYSTGVINITNSSFTIATEGGSAGQTWVAIWYACGYIN